MSDGKPQYREMRLCDIKVDPALQSRVKTDLSVVQDYAEVLSSGAVFPPVTLFFDGNYHLMADGFHRYEAFKLIGRNTIPADIREGTRQDAVLFSVSANSKIGLRPTTADRKKAAWMLFSLPGSLERPVVELARICGITEGTANRYRAAYCDEKNIPVPATVIAKNGSVRATTHEPRYGVARAAPGNGRDRAYLHYKGNKIQLGVDGEDARKRFQEKVIELKEKESAVCLPSPEKFVDWAVRRGVLVRGNESGANIAGLRIGDHACFLAQSLDPCSIREVVGGVLMYSQHIRVLGRTIVVLLLPDFRPKGISQSLVRIASELGIEFMTPEQLVAEFGPKPDRTGNPDDPQPEGKP